MMWGGGYGFGFMGVGMMVVVWGIVIALAFFAVRWLMDRNQGGRTSNAMGILKERLARGEIDSAEYEARRKILEG
ncbi:MAG: SHOCT domain-containing protein [Paracoccaceae bacterium]|nr:SHOCT domain-containing protein [Paracoccaceae bacterium]